MQQQYHLHIPGCSVDWKRPKGGQVVEVHRGCKFVKGQTRQEDPEHQMSKALSCLTVQYALGGHLQLGKKSLVKNLSRQVVGCAIGAVPDVLEVPPNRTS